MRRDKRELLVAYIDGELSEEERLAFEAELKRNQELRTELEEFKNLKEVTSVMQYADLPQAVWDNYWQSLYKKLERGFGWIFFSVGAIVLIAFGLFKFFEQLYIDPDVSFIIKAGVSTLTIGVAILFVSLTRERLFAYKHDRYKEVNR